MPFLFIWLLLVCFALFLAPGKSGDAIFSAILSRDLSGIDPLVLAVFNSLGIFPLIFLTILLLNDRQRWPAWPFALLSLGAGAFALLPYFAFGDKPAITRTKPRTPNWLMRFLASPIWFLVLLFMWIGNLLTLLQGFSLAAYREAFVTSKLVSVMTIDWFVLWGLSVYTVYRFFPQARTKGLAWLPIIGPVFVIWLNKKRN